MEPQLQKCLHQAEQVKRDDPFSRLPDEIIVSHILSRFTLEEGARYNIVSHRWKKLLSCSIGSKFIFAPEHLRSTHLTEKERHINSIDARVYQTRHSLNPKKIIDDRINRLRFCCESWISNVLQTYGRPILDELTIRFPFDFRNCDSIDRWVECALKKGVTRLELDLRRWGKIVLPKTYGFPRIEKLQGMLANCGGLYNLREVNVKCVYVPSDVIEFMLIHFPLERLCIAHSYIGKLSLSEESARLKSLELVGCTVDLKISASSLTSLTYTGEILSSLHLEHVPHLSELSIDGEFCSTFLQTGFLREGYVSRLKRLEFVMSAEDVHVSVNYPLEFAITLGLEELKVEIRGKEHACFLWPLLLIKAAPFLRKLSVKLQCIDWDWVQDRRLYVPLRNAAKRVQHHRHLKTVELHDYWNYPSASELVQHLLGVSDVLEQILVSPLYGNPSSDPIIRSQAETIAMWLPPSSEAKLIIL